MMLFTFSGWAQEDAVIIDSIIINGNKKTREKIILREITFKKGDKIQQIDLQEKFKQSQSNLLNTALFYTADFNIKTWDDNDHVTIELNVQEGWYLFPVPIFDLADRNFNVWWQRFNGSLKRVNYGLSIQYLNLTGNNDLLKANIQFGFTPKYELEYTFPYLDNKKNWRPDTEIFYSTNKNINYAAEGNRELFAGDQEEIIFSRFRSSLGIAYRPNFFASHNFRVTYHFNTAQDTIITLNPDFFLDGRKKQQFFELNYSFNYKQLDLNLYPLDGYEMVFEINKDGLGIFNDINSFSASLNFKKYTRLSKKMSIGNSLKGSYSLVRKDQPYNNYSALGGGDDFVRGYELYVLDGLDYAYLKNSIKTELLNKNISWGRMMPIDHFKVMPLRMYLSLHFDTGYVNDPFYFQENSFRNRWIYGYGLGLDFIFYNNFAFTAEFSINHTGEKGLFLSNNVSF